MRLLERWTVPLFMLIGFALALTCQVRKSQSFEPSTAARPWRPANWKPETWEPSIIQRRGNITIVSDDGRTSKRLAESVVYRGQKLIVHFRETAKSDPFFAVYDDHSTLYAWGPRSEWSAMLVDGIRQAMGDLTEGARVIK